MGACIRPGAGAAVVQPGVRTHAGDLRWRICRGRELAFRNVSSLRLPVQGTRRPRSAPGGPAGQCDLHLMQAGADQGRGDRPRPCCGPGPSAGEGCSQLAALEHSAGLHPGGCTRPGTPALGGPPTLRPPRRRPIRHFQACRQLRVIHSGNWNFPASQASTQEGGVRPLVKHTWPEAVEWHGSAGGAGWLQP